MGAKGREGQGSTMVHAEKMQEKNLWKQKWSDRVKQKIWSLALSFVTSVQDHPERLTGLYSFSGADLKAAM